MSLVLHRRIRPDVDEIMDAFGWQRPVLAENRRRRVERENSLTPWL